MAGLFHHLRSGAQAVFQNGVRFLATPVQPDEDAGELPLTLTSPLRSYALLHLLAEGDVADVFVAHTAGDGVIPPEPCWTLKVSRSAEGDALLDKERAALTHLVGRAGDSTYRKYLPALAESFAAQDGARQRVNVFRHEQGFYTLEQVHEQHPALDGRHLAWIFKRMLTVLGFCHRLGRLHGAVLPSHALLHPGDHRLQLIGWGQSVPVSHRVGKLSTRYQTWYPPEILRKQPASPASDLFLAARCVIYLAGGDPVSGRMPDTVPVRMQQFVKSCLLEGAKMRPDDAWELGDEFDELLQHLYGPPKFHALTMN